MNYVDQTDITNAEGDPNILARARNAIATFNLIKRNLAVNPDVLSQDRNAIAAQLTIAALGFKP